MWNNVRRNRPRVRLKERRMSYQLVSSHEPRPRVSDSFLGFDEFARNRTAGILFRNKASPGAGSISIIDLGKLSATTSCFLKILPVAAA